MSQLAIIGQKKQAVGINIQAADRKDFFLTGSLIQQVQNCLMTVIFCRRNDSLRLVEKVVDEFFIGQPLARNDNLIRSLINLGLR